MYRCSIRPGCISMCHFAGYRLAFNYLRAHRFVDAMLVCHRILEQYPQYPRIQKEILDKARAAVKS